MKLGTTNGEGGIGKSNQAHAGAIDLQAFQAKLEASLGNIQALVDSWIPEELQQKSLVSSSSTSHSTFDSHSSRLRNSRLGLGSTKEKQTETRTDKIHQQIMKNHKKRETTSNGEEGTFKKQTDGANDEEEDSRTSTFNKRPAQPCSSVQEPPSKVAKLASTSRPDAPVSTGRSDPLVTPALPTNHTSSAPTPTEPSSTSGSLNLIANHSGCLSKRLIKKLRKLERAKFNHQHSPINNQTPVHNS